MKSPVVCFSPFFFLLLTEKNENEELEFFSFPRSQDDCTGDMAMAPEATRAFVDDATVTLPPTEEKKRLESDGKRIQ